ncbi:hypothetical protein D3C72_1766980 [compost metagenome]
MSGFGGIAMAPIGLAQPIAELGQLAGEDMQPHRADIGALQQDRPGMFLAAAGNIFGEVPTVALVIGVRQARQDRVDGLIVGQRGHFRHMRQVRRDQHEAIRRQRGG